MKPLTQNINGVDVPLYRLQNAKDQTVIRARTVSNTIYPNLPIPGPAQEYIPIMVDDYPTYDPIYSTVTTVEQAFKGVWQITYVVADLPKAEVLKRAEDAKRAQVPNIVPVQDSTESLTAVLAAIVSAGSFKFSAADQPFVDALLAQATKLATNRAKLAAANAAINAGQKPDLKTGWAVAAIAAAELTP